MGETTTVVTGANRGIGLELARSAARRGHRVFAACRHPDRAHLLHALVAENPHVTIVELHVDQAASVEALAQELDGTPIDVLINNAGTMGPPGAEQSVDTMRFEGWADTFAVNTIAPVRILYALRDNLERSGLAKAVTITSQMGALAVDMPFALAYSASKAAVNKAMRLLAPEYAKRDIIVSLIHPGWVRTDMGGPDADISAEESAAGIWSVIDALCADDAGSFYSWNGSPHPW